MDVWVDSCNSSDLIIQVLLNDVRLIASNCSKFLECLGTDSGGSVLDFGCPPDTPKMLIIAASISRSRWNNVKIAREDARVLKVVLLFSCVYLLM